MFAIGCFRFCPKAAAGQFLRKRRVGGMDAAERALGQAGSARRSAGRSEGSVYPHCPARGVEDTGNEDAPLAVTEGGIKPERLGRQTDDKTPPTPAAEQHCSDRTHEYGGLGGKLEPRPLSGRRCLPG
jgi:hypothetical protein